MIDECGCGESGQYFSYAVGAEYGTAGMQSAISGQLTGCCGGMEMAQPAAPMAPVQVEAPAAPAADPISIDAN